MGEVPLMTDKGSFVINGTERVTCPRCIARLACSSSTTGQNPSSASFVLGEDHSLPRLMARLRIRSKDVLYSG